MRSARTLAAAAAILFAVVACGGSGSSSTSGTSCSKTFKVGLVTDVGKLSDKSFNATIWLGIQDAQADKGLCVKANFIESNQPTDYQKNMQTFVDQGYSMVVANGFLMQDDALASAKANPNTKFAIVDGSYASPPANMTGLVFKEDQPGFLVGALAGLLTKTNVVGAVGGLKLPAVQRYLDGYAAGVKYTNANGKVLQVYQGPGDGAAFNNPDWGKARATDEFNQNADIVFGVGGNTGNGALLGAVAKSKMCIGVDTDQYISYPDAKSCLVTSAEKKLRIAVYTVIADMVHNTSTGGLLTFDAKNQGVGISPYHDFDSKVPADVKTKINDILKKLADGSLQTGVKV